MGAAPPSAASTNRWLQSKPRVGSKQPMMVGSDAASPVVGARAHAAANGGRRCVHTWERTQKGKNDRAPHNTRNSRHIHWVSTHVDARRFGLHITSASCCMPPKLDRFSTRHVSSHAIILDCRANHHRRPPKTCSVRSRFPQPKSTTTQHRYKWPNETRSLLTPYDMCGIITEAKT